MKLSLTHRRAMLHASSGFCEVAKCTRDTFQELRNLGFIETDYSRSKVNGWLRIFECTRGDRFLSVQIWQHGFSRVSHGSIIDDNPRRRSETTTPTTFMTLAEMYRSIAFEWQRPSMKPHA